MADSNATNPPRRGDTARHASVKRLPQHDADFLQSARPAARPSLDDGDFAVLLSRTLTANVLETKDGAACNVLDWAKMPARRRAKVARELGELDTYADAKPPVKASLRARPAGAEWDKIMSARSVDEVSDAGLLMILMHDLDTLGLTTQRPGHVAAHLRARLERRGRLA